MRKKRSISDILNDLDKIKEFHPSNNASEKIFKRIQGIRDKEGYKSDYECLVELGIIEEVIAPHNTINLFPFIKQKHMLVKQAMADQKVRARVHQLQADFKEACKGN